MARFWLKILLILAVFSAALVFILINSVSLKAPKAFGVTFSGFYAERFGLDWKKAYLAIFDDLGIKKIRLPAYWNEIEPEEGVFDFSRLDWQVEEAEKRGAEIILAVGRKLPRWPECHIPEWTRAITFQEQNEALLRYIVRVVEHYKNSPAIKIWQVENEPFLPFGECPKFSKDFLDKEIALVRSLDPPPGGRPIMITDSGELSIWIRAAKRSDIFGSTMYRTVWNKFVGTFTYPLPPSFFRFKRALTELFVGEKPMIIIELQGESWAEKQTYEISVEEQYKSMNPEEFKKALNYASRSGFDTFYLWGAEWWYWLKETQNKPEMWEIAKEAIKLQIK